MESHVFDVVGVISLVENCIMCVPSATFFWPLYFVSYLQLVTAGVLNICRRLTCMTAVASLSELLSTYWWVFRLFLLPIVTSLNCWCVWAYYANFNSLSTNFHRHAAGYSGFSNCVATTYAARNMQPFSQNMLNRALNVIRNSSAWWWWQWQQLQGQRNHNEISKTKEQLCTFLERIDSVCSRFGSLWGGRF